MRSYETEYQFPLRHLNTESWRHTCVRCGEGGGELGGGVHTSSPARPTFMPAQGALLTTNKSTARSNLSQRSVGRGSGVWRGVEGGGKGKRKRWRWKEKERGGVGRKTEKVTRKEVNTHGPCRHTPSCCYRQLLHQLTGHFPLHHYIHRGQGQTTPPQIPPAGPFHPWLDLFKWTKKDILQWCKLLLECVSYKCTLKKKNPYNKHPYFPLLGSAHAFLVSPLWTVWTSGPRHYSALFCSTILFYRPYRQLQATK